MIWENIRLAIQTLRANKMRALLTMLGIIIGIMSIIGILMIGDAMTASISGDLSTLGTDNITLNVKERGAGADSYISNRIGNNQSQSDKVPATGDLISDQMISDLHEVFAGEIAGVSIGSPAGIAQAKDGGRYANITIQGVNADYIMANNITMLAGSFITSGDVERHGRVAVVSDKFVQNMCPIGDPIGREVKIYKSTTIELYTIVGVYEHTQSILDSGTASEQDMRTNFYIPFTTAKQDLIEKNYRSVVVVCAPESNVNDLTIRLENYFANLYVMNKDWEVKATTMSTVLNVVDRILGTLSVAITFIAAISLLVGGIGVMNIMLVSVTERTREIGTRKAMGAMDYHIQLQFVTEAIIIAVLGGIIGLVLGIGVGIVAASLFGAPINISPLTTIGSVIFSMVIGVAFGLYPANKAAKLDPIEALRYE